MEQPNKSLIKTLEIIREYGKISGFKLNLNKTKLLVKNLSLAQKEELENLTQIKIYPKIKYLGILITPKNINLYNDNYSKCWNDIKRKLETWNRLNISFLGRVPVIKMNVLPKLLFLFQTLPIIGKTSNIDKWQKEISKFLWRGKRPRIKHKILINTIDRGGFGLPDLKTYYEAACLLWLKEWCLLKNWKILDLEGHNNRFGWHAYLNYGKTKVHRGFFNHIIRNAIYRVWDKYKSYLETKTPRWISPFEAVAVKKKNNEKEKWITYNLLLTEREGKIELEKCEEIKNYLSSWLDYFQINEMYKQDKVVGFEKEPSKFERELLIGNTKLISRMYKLLLEREVMDETVTVSMTKWAQDVGHPIMFEEWEKLWQVDLKFTANYNIRENMLKMAHRWYLTPSRLSKMYKSLANICWRCGAENADMIHMWWRCCKIKVFWGEVYEELKKMMGISFTKRPEMFLLSMVDKEISNKKKEVLLYALAAARIVVAKGWKNQEVPKIIEWQSKLQEFAEMALLTSNLRGNSKQKFIGKWDVYRRYVLKYNKSFFPMPAFEG